MFVKMDETFHEDVPFYSSEGKVVNDENQGEPVTLVQLVSPPSYLGQLDDHRKQRQEMQPGTVSETAEEAGTKGASLKPM